jgi:hypothetical protein
LDPLLNFEITRKKVEAYSGMYGWKAMTILITNLPKHLHSRG